jgi:RecJ-like exonuclease
MTAELNDPEFCPACNGSGEVHNEAWDLFGQWARETFEVDIWTCPADQLERISQRFAAIFGKKEETCPTCQGTGKQQTPPDK